MDHLLCPPSNRETFRRPARCHPMVLKEWLEPDAGRPARPVLRGRRRSDASQLPDKDSITVAYAIDAGEVECWARPARLGPTSTACARACSPRRHTYASCTRQVHVVMGYTVSSCRRASTAWSALLH